MLAPAQAPPHPDLLPARGEKEIERVARTVSPKDERKEPSEMARRRKKPGKRGLYNKRLTPEEQAAQREAAVAAIRRLYCEALPLWRSCPRGYRRRHRRCRGDARACLKRGWPLMPPELQSEACRQVAAGGPRRLPPATHTEWDLRRYPPTNFVH